MSNIEWLANLAREVLHYRRTSMYQYKGTYGLVSGEFWPTCVLVLYMGVYNNWPTYGLVLDMRKYQKVSYLLVTGPK